MNLTVARLALAGSRGSWGRLLGIVAGVAVGVTLFLLLFGASNALQARDQRSSWLYPSIGEVDGQLSDENLLVRPVADRHDGAAISRLDVASTPASTVKIPGVPSAPRPGEFYASQALVDRIATVPADELGDRFGTLVGILPDSVLKSPNSLVAVVGQYSQTLAGQYSSTFVTSFPTQLFGSSGNYQAVAIIGAIALLFPVLLLVSIVTGLGAAERRERFATLRLVGASPRTVVAIATIETAATSLVGALLGVLLAALLRPVAALLSIDGGTFFVSDLVVPPLLVLATVIVTVVASTAVAARRVARAGIGPLGATRQQNESTPRARRLIPLVLGLVAMVGTSLLVQYTPLALRADLMIIAAFLLTSVGLLIAGPYLTSVAAKLVAGRAGSAAGVIATGRILRAPTATFRSVSGLVIAVFMVSVFAGGATTAAQDVVLDPGPGLLPAGTVVAHTGASGDFPSSDLDALGRLRGVTDVSVLYYTETSAVLSARDAKLIGLTDLPDTAYVEFSGDLMASDPNERVVSASSITSTDDLRIAAVLVHTDGTTAAIERARTWMENSGLFDLAFTVPGTRADAVDAWQLTLIASFSTLAYLGIGIATLIAGVSLAVATVSAVLDRRRVLGLLRLIGMPVSGVRRIVTFEAAVPLIAVVALSVVLGLLSAWVILTGLTAGRRTLGWPDPLFYVALGSSVLLALGSVVATFGTIRRATTVSSTRFE